MENRNQVIKSIKAQFAAMEALPLFELELSNEEYLLVNLEMVKKGIEFRFDSDNKKTWFSGDVLKTGEDVYLVKCDEYTTDLDGYLQKVYDEITEGYLLPNTLFVS